MSVDLQQANEWEQICFLVDCSRDQGRNLEAVRTHVREAADNGMTDRAYEEVSRAEGDGHSRRTVKALVATSAAWLGLVEAAHSCATPLHRLAAFGDEEAVGGCRIPIALASPPDQLLPP